MATSFITKDNVYGFWINDSLMQVVCWGILNVIDENVSYDNTWLKGEFREHVFNNSQGIFVGFMHLRLDEFLFNKDAQNKFNEVLLKVKDFFLSKGDHISILDLNAFQLIKETRHEWLLPLETNRLVNIVDYLQNVANDNISIKESDEVNYEF